MPFIGEFRIFPYTFIPTGWIECAGQLLNANQYAALFTVIGTIYGGDAARLTFALPDLRNRVPVHPGRMPDDQRTVTLGQQLGTAMVTLTNNQIPAHRHPLQRKSASGVAQKTNLVTSNSDLAQLAVVYDNSGSFDLVPHLSTSTPDTTLAPATIGQAGFGQAHENRQPHMLLVYAICNDGDFPVRQ